MTSYSAYFWQSFQAMESGVSGERAIWSMRFARVTSSEIMSLLSSRKIMPPAHVVDHLSHGPIFPCRGLEHEQGWCNVPRGHPVQPGILPERGIARQRPKCTLQPHKSVGHTEILAGSYIVRMYQYMDTLITFNINAFNACMVQA